MLPPFTLPHQHQPKVSPCPQYYPKPASTGKVSVSRYQLDKSSASRQDRDAARRRSRTATSQLRHALRDYKIVLQDDDSSTTHARKPWTVLHSGVVIARFTDVGDAAQFVATA